MDRHVYEQILYLFAGYQSMAIIHILFWGDETPQSTSSLFLSCISFCCADRLRISGSRSPQKNIRKFGHCRCFASHLQHPSDSYAPKKCFLVSWICSFLSIWRTPFRILMFCSQDPMFEALFVTTILLYQLPVFSYHIPMLFFKRKSQLKKKESCQVNRDKNPFIEYDAREKRLNQALGIAWDAWVGWWLPRGCTQYMGIYLINDDCMMISSEVILYYPLLCWIYLYIYYYIEDYHDPWTVKSVLNQPAWRDNKGFWTLLPTSNPKTLMNHLN